MGLTDDEAMRKYRKQVLAQSPNQNNGVNPFEKAAGMEAPVPIWEP